MLLSDLLYLAVELVRLLGAYAGIVPLSRLAIQLSYDLIGMALFYLLVRSGFSSRFKDPAMTLPQILLGLSSVVLSYAMMDVGRGAALPLLCVIMVYGMLFLSPRQTAAAGSATVFMLAGVLAVMHQVDEDGLDLARETLNIALAAIILPALGVVAKQISELQLKGIAQRTELTKALTRLEELATRDGLTRLANRRHMLDLLLAECKRHARLGHPYCLAIIDIDGLKKINDDHGHAQGDDILRQLALLGTTSLRTSDVMGRWGGQEFVVMLPESDLAGGLQSMQRLRDDLAGRWGFIHEGRWRSVTSSMGVTQYLAGETISEMLERADQALHLAKSQGRDQAVAR